MAAPHGTAPALTAPVVIIGPMAAGKSFLGARMADAYGYTFIDADQVIVSRHGSIPDLFEQHGETRFRQLEEETIRELLDPRQHPAPHRGTLLLGLGGGAPMNPEVASMLPDTVVVYLKTDLETVRTRITGGFTRPMLRPDPVARWTELYEQRRPTFERLADITLDVAGRPVQDVANELNHRLSTWEDHT